MNVAQDKTIILGLQIYLDHRLLSSIDQEVVCKTSNFLVHNLQLHCVKSPTSSYIYNLQLACVQAPTSLQIHLSKLGVV